MKKNIILIIFFSIVIHTTSKSRLNSPPDDNDTVIPTRSLTIASKLLDKANKSQNINEVQNILKRLKKLKPRYEWHINRVQDRLDTLDQEQQPKVPIVIADIPAKPAFPPPVPPAQFERLTQEELQVIEEFEKKVSVVDDKKKQAKKVKFLSHRQRAELEEKRKKQEARDSKAAGEARQSKKAKEELKKMLAGAEQYGLEEKEPVETTKLKLVFAAREQTPRSGWRTLWKEYYLPAAAHQALEEWLETETKPRLSYIKKLAQDQILASNPQSPEYKAWTEIIEKINSALKKKPS